MVVHQKSLSQALLFLLTSQDPQEEALLENYLDGVAKEHFFKIYKDPTERSDVRAQGVRYFFACITREDLWEENEEVIEEILNHESVFMRAGLACEFSEMDKNILAYRDIDLFKKWLERLLEDPHDYVQQATQDAVEDLANWLKS